jgi:hypothetical protein
MDNLIKVAAEKALRAIDPDFREYTPDQGMPPVVYEMNDAQIDHFAECVARAAYQQALADVRAGVPPKIYEVPIQLKGLGYTDGSNTTRNTVLEHLDLLGKE